MMTATTLLTLCVFLLLGTAALTVLIFATWRDAGNRLRRITSQRRMVQRENDIAGRVEDLVDVLRCHQTALDKLVVAQGETHGAVGHLLSHVHPSQDQLPERVIYLGLFGQLPGGDA